MFNLITEVPLETPVRCLKSAPSTFQKTLFKHGFWSNNFQTILFWKRWPNTFFKILDTSVQYLNTEHCVLKRVTKRALSLDFWLWYQSFATWKKISLWSLKMLSHWFTWPCFHTNILQHQISFQGIDLIEGFIW